ncbi:Arc family DNA-binding protein [Endothiovibrio diazotrophicus]
MKKKATQKKRQNAINTQIRYPEEVYRALRRAGARSGRSLNAEVIFRLRQSLAFDAEGLDGPPKDEREAIGRALDRLAGKVLEFSDLLGDARDRLDEPPPKR